MGIISKRFLEAADCSGVGYTRYKVRLGIIWLVINVLIFQVEVIDSAIITPHAVVLEVHSGPNRRCKMAHLWPVFLP